MLKKLKMILIVTCCLMMASSTIFAEAQNDKGKGFTISGYTFTYENAPQELKDQYEQNCLDIGVVPQPNDEIFITTSELKTYSDNGIDMSLARESNFTVRYYYAYFEVTGDKNYTVSSYAIVKYGNSGNPVHLVQLLLKRVGYSLTADSQFGNDTLSKVKNFQSNHGLSSDGVVGNATWQKFASVGNLV
ncbi:TPA: peptidoglycan-binding protein [Clostridioides difficile]|nr:peptidoglycan-binding protein [Clostridioides difficile]